MVKLNKTAELTTDEIAKLIIGLILLFVLITIITIYIKGGLDEQSSKIGNIFDLLFR